MTTVNILLVDDSEDDVAFIERCMQRAGAGRFTLAVEESGAAGLARMRTAPPDCLLLDHGLPDMDGLEVLESLRTGGCSPPFAVLMLTGSEDDGIALAALRAGADDYLVKGELSADGLRRAVDNAIEKCRLRNERQAFDQARDAFLATVSHELRTPLTSMRGYAQLMQRRQAYDERAVNAIVNQATRMGSLVDDLLDVARLSAGNLDLNRAECDLVLLIEAAIERSRMSGATHTILQELPPPPVLGTWDAMRIAQILDNLLSNAIKYSPAGSTVIVRLHEHDDAAYVQVEDQGVGIPSELLPRLFDRFFRVGAVQVQGLGLGLHITRELVRGHGGDIEVESEAGKGTRFTIVLPYHFGAARD